MRSRPGTGMPSVGSNFEAEKNILHDELIQRK